MLEGSNLLLVVDRTEADRIAAVVHIAVDHIAVGRTAVVRTAADRIAVAVAGGILLRLLSCPSVRSLFHRPPGPKMMLSECGSRDFFQLWTRRAKDQDV